MPYVNVKIVRDGADAGLKARLIERVTAAVAEVLDKDPAMVMVVIDEVDADNWGVAGQSVTVRRQSKG